MLTWIKTNPIQTTVNVSAVLFIIFVILAIFSYFKVADAKKKGKEADKGWFNFICYFFNNCIYNNVYCLFSKFLELSIYIFIV